MTLPTFNPDKLCPQCSHVEVGVHYVDDSEYSCQSTYAPPAYAGARSACHYHSGPHFHRTCRRCGFAWAEAAGVPSMTYRGPHASGKEANDG